MTHFAVIVSSGRAVPVIRRGRLLMVINHVYPNGDLSISTCRYDRRFKLMPKGWEKENGEA